MTRTGRWRLWSLCAGAILVALLTAAILNPALRQVGALPRETPAVHADRILPASTLRLPETGEAPYPVTLLLSGCDGVRDNMERWARFMTARGRAALIVDSHGPRGLDDAQLWRLVCAGQTMTGAERAADIAVALEKIAEDPRLDAGDVIFVGASHGGWAVLDYLTLAAAHDVPPTLTRWPPVLRDAPLDGLRAAILLYPYCGELSRAYYADVIPDVPLLFLLARDDTIVDETDCERLAERAPDASLHVYDGVTHGFDTRERSAISPLVYDPQATRDAETRVQSFLDAH